MFFVLSKTLGLLSVPSNIFILLGIAGALLLLTRFARTGRRLLIASVLLIAVFGFLPVGQALTMLLEDRFPKWDASRGAPDGIIILGAAMNADLSKARGQIVLSGEAERFTEVAALARRYPSARIVFSGGTGSLRADAIPEARYVVPLLESFGIPASRIALEDRSRNTEENALFTKELVQPKSGERWLLVTSGFHMPRSVGCFRRAGFEVEAYPVDWRTFGRWDEFSINARVSDGLGHTDNAIREWVGLVVYWLTGRTSELFPAPR
ncbi:MAG: YdcF family protein [Pseudomonadota bacterium]